MGFQQQRMIADERFGPADAKRGRPPHAAEDNLLHAVTHHRITGIDAFGRDDLPYRF